MIRLALASLLTCMLLLAGWALADDPMPGQDEPPVRLKKKGKPLPDAGPEKKTATPADKSKPSKKLGQKGEAKDDKDDDETEALELEQKIKETMARLGKNLQEAEERLTKKDSGDATQQVQRDIVKDLEDLTEQMRRQQQQQMQKQQQKMQQRRNQQARNKGKQKNRQPGQPELAPDEPQNAQDGKSARGGTSPRGEMSKIADLYKDIWGHLPEGLRQEMNQYSREQFMAKYNELLKQYYATIAEKGRRKGEQ